MVASVLAVQSVPIKLRPVQRLLVLNVLLASLTQTQVAPLLPLASAVLQVQPLMPAHQVVIPVQREHITNQVVHRQPVLVVRLIIIALEVQIL